MGNAFDGLEPRLLWEQFESITQVPRPSKKEEKIIAFMEGWAAKHGFVVKKDHVSNILIQVPATPGREGSPTVCLQGHMDMVAEKNEETVFDFETEGIKVWRDGDLLKAEGTTLGADNGIGLAMAMAAAIDPDLEHGPLELLFTVDEETGLTGASELKPGFLSATKLINIDSEDEGVLFVGCAGGGDTDLFWSRPKNACSCSQAWTVQVTGLAGGHSGLDIIQNRANALKVLAGFLNRLRARTPICLTSIGGGDKHNAIPRQATAVFCGDGVTDAILEEVRAEAQEALTKEFAGSDPKGTIVIGQADSCGPCWCNEDVGALLDLALALPHGVQTMSRDLPGLVETSSNLARILTDGDKVSFLLSSRSSVRPALDNHREAIDAIARLAGAEISRHPAYPGWQPDMNSGILKHCVAVHEEVVGKTPEVTAIHAGLECGIIGAQYPGMEMISMGPTMSGVHSPDEQLSIGSTNRVYEYLKAVLAKMA